MKSLNDWLESVGNIHSKAIDMGLERVGTVAKQMGLTSFKCPVITVAGTNGKGSVVTILEQSYHMAGYQTGSLTSPDLLYYNERVKINAEPVRDEALCNAFAAIEAQRGDITLTFFEFNVLVALYCFQQQSLDVIILEVGMGGRLDATNIIDTDLAVITSIGLDHMEFLGDTREMIALEKAGICRQGKPAVIGDLDPPQSLLNYLKDNKIKVSIINQDFHYSEHADHWHWQHGDAIYSSLPIPSLLLQNCATALTAIDIMQACLPVTIETIRTALQTVALAGRFEINKQGNNTIIFDVAHNEDSCRALADNLRQHFPNNNISAVFSIFHNKDIAKCINLLKPIIMHWHIAELDHERGCTLEHLQQHFTDQHIKAVQTYKNIEDAYQQALKDNNLIVVFGSFATVAAIKKEIA